MGRIVLPRGLLPSFFLYSLCGGIATIFDWGSFYIYIKLFKWHYILAGLLSFSLGTVVNYSTNKFITFRNYYRKLPLQYGLFLLGALTALLITLLMMFIFAEFCGISPMYARIITTAIMLFYNFIFHKYLTFGWLK